MRLWGRWWLGLFAVAIAAVASGPAESALGAGAPPVRASAEAITVLAPDSPAQGSGLVMAFGPALPGGAYHYPHPHGVIQAGWAKATAAKQTGASPTATATSLVRRVRVFGGAVQARKIWVSVSLVPGTAQATGAVQGLVVLGRHVHAVAGKTLALAHWGTLDVLASQQSQAPGSATAAITGLRLTLLQDHGGLAAGTVVELGSANAVIAPAPLRTPPPGGGTTTPSAPQRTHGATLHPRPTAPATPPQTPPAGHPTHHPAHHPAHHPPAQRRHRSAGTVPPQSSHALIAAARGGRARVLAAALAQVGWPYIWGGDSRSDGGFDCSGLVDYAYARAGLTLPGRPTAAVLWQMSAPVTRARLQPGDLAFLYSRTRAPYHVALYVGDGLMVVAPHTGARSSSCRSTRCRGTDTAGCSRAGAATGSPPAWRPPPAASRTPGRARAAGSPPAAPPTHSPRCGCRSITRISAPHRRRRPRGRRPQPSSRLPGSSRSRACGPPRPRARAGCLDSRS